MKKTKFLLMLLATLFIASCSTPKDITYFQDTWEGDTYAIGRDLDIRLQKGDKLTVVVHSRDPQLSQMFNLPIASQRVGYTTLNNSNQQMSAYTVDDNGNIDVPNVGTIMVAGLNRTQVAQTVKNLLVQKDLVKDPVVTVEFDNMFINVLGEVNHPGRYALTKDRVTVLDALGMAGDMTIQGERRFVKVIRHEGQTRKAYTLDFTKLNQVVNSPAYYLQQDDVVYVDPNAYRKRQTTVNGNNARSTATYISLASLLTSIAVLIFK